MNLNFLIKAKQNTYALGGEGGERKVDDGSKEFLYEEDNLVYRDRYFNGKGKFIGEEVLYENSKVVWGMNYYGKMLLSENPSLFEKIKDFVDTQKTYLFLKKAMMQVSVENPFRGPDIFKEDDFKYTNKTEGTLEYFSGKEEIFYKGDKIYELIYHGGVI